MLLEEKIFHNSLKLEEIWAKLNDVISVNKENLTAHENDLEEVIQSSFSIRYPGSTIGKENTTVDMYESEEVSELEPSLKPKINNYSTTLQKWQGYINQVDFDERKFEAILNDITDEGTKEIAEFDFSDVSPDDRKLIEDGAVFYWSIGYSNYNGQTKKESLLRFQRVVEWSEEDYNIASDSASDLNKKLNFQ